jgi:nicotinate phosphoribosyltransferase
LVDTYDTLNSGVPNAITVFKEVIAKGGKPQGIRLDSGDLAYLSVEARKMLDNAGLSCVKIFASGDLDENILDSLIQQGAKTDAYGIGTKLITGGNSPSLGGVYKLSAVEESGKFVPKMKVSDTARKITNPGFKKTVRLLDKQTGKAIADVIALRDENFDGLDSLEIFHPEYTWLRKTVTNFTARELMQPIFKDGKQVYKSPSLAKIVEYAKGEVGALWEQYKRIINPQIYKVDLSEKLWKLKQELLKK